MKPLNRNIGPPFKTIDKVNITKASKHVFTNGLPFYGIHARAEDIIKINFIFNAGYWYQEKPLIAMSTNSMLSEGSKLYASSHVSEKLDYYGAHLLAETDNDQSEITVYCLTKHLSEVIKILEDIIKYPTFPEKELATFIQKKRQQFIIENAKVKVLAKEKFAEVIFGKNHPYGRSICLTDFENISPTQLFDFHNRYYNAGNCKIIASGKVTDKEIKIMEKHFGIESWKGKIPPGNSNPAIEPSAQKNHAIFKENVSQSAIRIGKSIFNKLHPDFMGMEVLNTVLGGYFGSRLMKNIREDKGYTYGITSHLVSLKHSGFWVINSEVGAEVCKNAINEIYLEINKLHTDTIPQEEVELVKNYMMGDLLKNFDGPFALAESFKSILDFDLDYDYFDNYICKIKNITKEELRSLAQKYLDTSTMYEITAGSKILMHKDE